MTSASQRPATSRCRGNARNRIRIAAILSANLLAGCAVVEDAPPDRDVLSSWQAAGDLAEAFRNFDRYYPVQDVPAGLPRALGLGEPIEDLSWPAADGTATLDEFMPGNRTTGLLVLHRGAIVLERYGPGADARTRFTSFSMAKSVTSTLVGAALDAGRIASLDDPVTRYLPELVGSAYAGVTIRQVLTMTSGVSFSEEYTDAGSDLADFAANGVGAGRANEWLIERTARSAPAGARFNYNTSETQVLGWLVERVTGQHLAGYLSRRLWIPLGMEAPASWVVDRPGGAGVAGFGIQARLRDWGRLGELMLADGQLNGARLLPPGWVAEATTPALPATQFGALYDSYPLGYGYQWWLYPDGRYEAQGIHGQFLLIDPEYRLVIVKTSAWPDAWDDALEREFVALADAIRDRIRRRGQ